MTAAQADDYLSQAAKLYLAGDIERALDYARAALAEMGVTIGAMQGGSQVQAQQQRSHQQIKEFIEQLEAELAKQTGSRRLRVQPVEYRRAGGATEC